MKQFLLPVRGSLPLKTSHTTLQQLNLPTKGHSYIWFHSKGGWDGHDGIVHNPDCHCYK